MREPTSLPESRTQEMTPAGLGVWQSLAPKGRRITLSRMLMFITRACPKHRVVLTLDPTLNPPWFAETRLMRQPGRGQRATLVEALWALCKQVAHALAQPLPVAPRDLPFGERLRAALDDREMSVADLAGAVGCSSRLVYAMVERKTAPAYSKYLADVAMALQVPLSWLQGNGSKVTVQRKAVRG